MGPARNTLQYYHRPHTYLGPDLGVLYGQGRQTHGLAVAVSYATI